MAEQKLLLGNVRGPKGDPGPNTLSSSTTTSGFENGHVLFNNNGKVGAKSLLDFVYPVGSIFEWCASGISGAPDLSTAEKMAKYFGGTWREFGMGQVLVGLDTSQTEFAAVGKTGGEKTHTLTVNEIPAHNHEANISHEAGENYLPLSVNSPADVSDQIVTTNTGGGQAHNNLQPYITVYRWQRIA